MILKPTYMKSSVWLKIFEHSNSLYMRATRVITNYALIDKYHLKFFPREYFEYLCGLYPIELKQHILHEYRRYNNYWNSNKNFLKYFVTFLEFNLEVFSFYEGIT